MDPFHERLAHAALRSAEAYGFALAGGYAVQVHGFLERPSEDVDLFTTMSQKGRFDEAVEAVVTGLTHEGLTVEKLLSTPGFARLSVQDPMSREVAKVELGLDWRAHPPTRLHIGPVLHADDAVANKVGALYSRGQARDYIDVDAVLRSGRYSSADLLRLAVEHDPGVEPVHLARALRAAHRLPIAEFTAYGLTSDQAVALLQRLDTWAEDLAGE